jgi:protein TonB
MRPAEVTQQDQSRHRTIAFVTTTALNVLLLLILILVKAWTAPDPPLPVLGIELANLGNTSKGSGSVQTRNRPSNLPNREESKPAPEAVKPVRTPPVPEKSTPQPVKTPPVPEPPARVSRAESPVKVAEKPDAKEIKAVPPPPKAVSKPTAEPAKPAESKPVEQPKVDNKALYGKAKSNGTSGTNPNPGGNNNGPEGNSGVGDFGAEDGKVDGRSLYGKGKGGSGGGAQLSLTNWTWSRQPSPDVPDGIFGTVVLLIRVDEDGNLVGTPRIEKSLNPIVDRACIEAIKRVNFKPTGSGTPASASGKVTFVIRPR